MSRPPPPWDDAEFVPAFAALIALHDIGKFTRPFQAKVEVLWPPVLGALKVLAGPAHDTAGYALLTGQLADELDPLLPGWRSAQRVPVLSALCGHHGRPPGHADYLGRNIACAPCLAAARGFARDMIAALNPCPLPPPARDTDPALGWWLAGLAVLADWIGSAEAWFPYRAPGLSLGEYWRVALLQAEVAVAAAGLLPAAVRPHVGLCQLVGEDVPASPVQALAQTLDLGAAGPALVLVEDQTGSGKTEAALLLAHRLMATGRADGLFVALPTMATANAMYGRLADAYLRLFEDGAAPSLVLAHGRRADHKGFQASILRDAAAEGGGDDPSDEPASAQCAAWIADDRRRTFLAAVGVGTIDQALLAVLPSRHAPLRLHGLHRRVLVVDEAHAYDAYMREELLRLVEFQAGLGGSTVVLSATLPQATRRALAAAYARGAGAAQASPSSASYPLITVLHRDGAMEIPCDGRAGLARRVEVERLETEADALARVAEAARAGLAVAWIRNAVDDAAAAQAGLVALGVDATLFHARFAMGDRQDIETAVVDRYGKRGQDRRGVVVATQVIEQSLDLDFDLMVTDLAPMDLLIQRAGRLWRHARPDRSTDRPRLLLLAPEPVEQPGADWLGPELRRTGYVYGDHALLWRTARVLLAAGAIEAPGDVRRLVEAAYDLDEVPAGLQRQANDASGKASAATSLARQNLLDWRAGYHRNAGEWDSDVRTPTRLGEGAGRSGSAAGTLARCARGTKRTRPHAPGPSEVQLALRLATSAPPETGALAKAAKAVRAEWGSWDREVPILALSPEGDDWTVTVLRGEREQRVRYSSRTGLSFG